MGDSQASLSRIWMTKAFNDLDTARQIGGLPDGHLDMGIYHCQQAAEKALKSFLIFHSQPVEKIHDLEKIIAKTVEFEAGFTDYEEVAGALTPYAVLYRYPDEAAFIEPSRAEFDEAFAHARRIYDFVFTLLPPEARPIKKI